MNQNEQLAYLDTLERYFDLLESQTSLQRGLLDALDLIEDLLADPFVSFDTRWGGRIRRLSEWEDLWAYLGLPLKAALGDPHPERLPPPLRRLQDRVMSERSHQALPSQPTVRGVQL